MSSDNIFYGYVVRNMPCVPTFKSLLLYTLLSPNRLKINFQNLEQIKNHQPFMNITGPCIKKCNECELKFENQLLRA